MPTKLVAGAGFGSGILPSDLRAALRAVTVAGKAVPVLCGAALRNIGIQPLLDAVIAYLQGLGVELKGLR